MKRIANFLGLKPKPKPKPKPKIPRKKTEANIEKKFKSLLSDGYSINRARYFSRL
jgi:hypothetical protein